MVIIDLIKKLIQNIGCEHEYEFIRNIYGDDINNHNGMRSEWRCIKCDHIQYREDYHITGTLCEELNKLYDDFYENEYNSWKELRAKTLNNMIKIMTKAAYNGECYADFILLCEKKHNDKYYYEKWFNENALKYDYKLHNQNEQYTASNSYEFHVHWKY